MLQRGYHSLVSHGLFVISTVLTLGLLLVAFTVAACSTTGAVNITQMQHCGQVYTRNGIFSQSGDSVKQAEECFWHAFQQCNPATLTFEVSGIDAGIIHNFTIVNKNGTCSISDAPKHYIIPTQPRPLNTYTCAGLTQQTDGLHVLGCGNEGTVIVPAPL